MIRSLLLILVIYCKESFNVRKMNEFKFQIHRSHVNSVIYLWTNIFTENNWSLFAQLE